MPASVVPALIDALVTNARAALAGTANVYDGFGVSEAPGLNYVLIGVDDPDNDSVGMAADTQQDWANANYTARDESGDIVCASVAWNGDANQKAARDAAYANVNTIAALLKTTPAQGVPEVLWTSIGSRMQLSQDQNEKGANAIVVFRVYFRARI